MPLVRRKKVVLHDLPDMATPDAATTSTTDVFYIPETGEIFIDYESYSARMAFYTMKVFQCELTGKSGLDYFQALASERAEATTLHARFPSQLKAPVLSSVQWRMSSSVSKSPSSCSSISFFVEIMGRLDHLVELVYDRFVNRYYTGESEHAAPAIASLVHMLMHLQRSLSTSMERSIMLASPASSNLTSL